MRSALFLLLLLSGPVTWAQRTGTGNITGLVTDANSGEALPLVNISLNDPFFGTTSEMDGRFLLKDLPPGSYTLKASFVGYKDFVQTDVQVPAGSTVSLSVQLEYGIMLNNEVVVTASARSQAINLAPASLAVITAKQLQERQITTFDQAFDDVPGVVVTRSGNANVQTFSIRGASAVASATGCCCS
ncbi:MAG: Hemin receptor precursor [Bacteroidota bacterium]|jgi:outer membrane receptor protein involved in Fe transport